MGARLDGLVEQGAVVLHDRRVRGTSTRVDHVVIASSGVWVVETNWCQGQVDKVDIRRRLRRVERLFLDGQDRTDLLATVLQQVQAVRLALVCDDYDEVKTRAVLCLVGADWRLFPEPIEVGEVIVAWPTATAAIVGHGAALSPATIANVGGLLTRGFPPA